MFSNYTHYTYYICLQRSILEERGEIFERKAARMCTSGGLIVVWTILRGKYGICSMIYFMNHKLSMAVNKCCVGAVCAGDKDLDESTLISCSGDNCSVTVHPGMWYSICVFPISTYCWFLNFWWSLLFDFSLLRVTWRNDIIYLWKVRSQCWTCMRHYDPFASSCTSVFQCVQLFCFLLTLSWHDSCPLQECALCPARDGAFKRTTSGEWVHILCATYVPGSKFENGEKLSGVNMENIDRTHPKVNTTMSALAVDEQLFFV